jgi:hypothetical protein
MLAETLNYDTSLAAHFKIVQDKCYQTRSAGGNMYYRLLRVQVHDIQSVKLIDIFYSFIVL